MAWAGLQSAFEAWYARREVRSLARTRTAIEHHDRERARLEAQWEQVPNGASGVGMTYRLMHQIDKLGEEVGIAFGFDTIGLNSFETCRACVRCGPKHPAPGFDPESWLRRQVRLWEEGA